MEAAFQPPPPDSAGVLDIILGHAEIASPHGGKPANTDSQSVWTVDNGAIVALTNTITQEVQESLRMLPEPGILPLISLPWTDDTIVYGEITELHRSAGTDWSMHGDIVGTLNGQFVLAHSDGALSGFLFANGQVFQLAYLQKQNIPSHHTLHLHSISVKYSCETNASPTTGPTSRSPTSNHAIQGPQFVEIDWAVVYTETVRQNVGDMDFDGNSGTTADIHAQILAEAQRFDLYCANSDAVARMNVAAIYEVPAEFNMSYSFNQLMNNTNGIIDELPLFRDLAQADLVSFWIFNNGADRTGSSLLFNGNPEQYLSKLSVVALNPGPGLATSTTHEVGHQFGCAHTREDTSDNNPYSGTPYAWGYRAYSGPTMILATSLGLGDDTNLIPHYSNPDISYFVSGVGWTPTGIDHDSDPNNSADCARGIDTTAPTIAAYRSGSPSLSDCDNDGLFDDIALFLGSDSDYGGAIAAGGGFEPNGIPDSCDRTGWAADCSGAIADPALVQWEVILNRTDLPALGGIKIVEFRGVPAPQGTVLVTVNAAGNFLGNTKLEVYLNDVLAGTLFDGFGTDCTGTDVGQVNIDYTLFSLGDNDSLVVKLKQLPSMACTTSLRSEVTVEYLTVRSYDLDRDGILDACDPSCSPADISTPYGIIDFFDMQQFLNLYAAMDDEADIAAPLGVWDFFDIQLYQARYAAGCP